MLFLLLTSIFVFVLILRTKICKNKAGKTDCQNNIMFLNHTRITIMQVKTGKFSDQIQYMTVHCMIQSKSHAKMPIPSLQQILFMNLPTQEVHTEMQPEILLQFLSTEMNTMTAMFRCTPV